MSEVWIILAGVVIAAIMGGLKKPFAWVRRQHPAVKALIVGGIATGLYFGLKALGLAEGSGAEIPVAALAAMGVRELGKAFKDILNEDPEKKAARLDQ
jgi:hypothetical protein